MILDQHEIKRRLESLIPNRVRSEVYDTEYYSNFSLDPRTLTFTLKFKYKGQILIVTVHYFLIEDQDFMDALKRRVSSVIDRLDEMERSGELRTSIRPRMKEYIG